MTCLHTYDHTRFVNEPTTSAWTFRMIFYATLHDMFLSQLLLLIFEMRLSVPVASKQS
jgi:hypothetical protein